MRDKTASKQFYIQGLGFTEIVYLGDYLLLKKDSMELHLFEFKELNPLENDGPVFIRTTKIDELYQHLIDREILIHPQGKLQHKPWGPKEVALIDPEHILFTFDQSIPS